MTLNLKRFIVSLVLVMGLCCAASAQMMELPTYYPEEVALKALKGSATVSVRETDDYFLFSPNSGSIDVGIIFYAGALVPEEAYAPLMENLADRGVTCALMKTHPDPNTRMMNFADGILDSDMSLCKTWYLAGHSMGGNMAGTFILNQTDKYRGLIMVGAYTSTDLSKTSLKTMLITGTNDLVLNRDNYKKCLSNLPEGYVEHEIDGGNHALFGNYGKQLRDGDATVSASVQQNLTAEWILEFVK